MVNPDLVRLKDRAKLVVVFLENWVVHMVVAPRTAKCHAQKSLAGVIDDVLHPLLTTEQLEVSREVAGRAELAQIVRAGLVGREHRHDHAIVGLIAIERLDDPVAPVPDVRLAIANLLAPARPVAISPNVHPVASPALAISGTGKQPIDDLLVSIRDSSARKACSSSGPGGRPVKSR